MNKYRRLLSPDAVTGGESVGSGEVVATTPVSEFEFSGQKYKAEEVMPLYEAAKGIDPSELKQFNQYKEAFAAQNEIGALLKDKPELQKMIQDAYYEKLGYKPAPAQVQTQQPVQGQQAQPDLNPVYQRMQELQQRLDAQEDIRGQQDAEQQLSEAAKIYPFAGENGQVLLKASQSYVVEQAKQRVARYGGTMQEAMTAASGALAEIPTTQWPALTMPKEYAEFIRNQGGTGGSKRANPTVNPAAEAIGGGQAGPTPELREQFQKEYKAALQSGKEGAGAQVILKYSNLSGQSPLEGLGMESSMARALSSR